MGVFDKIRGTAVYGAITALYSITATSSLAANTITATSSINSASITATSSAVANTITATSSAVANTITATSSVNCASVTATSSAVANTITATSSVNCASISATSSGVFGSVTVGSGSITNPSSSLLNFSGPIVLPIRARSTAPTEGEVHIGSTSLKLEWYSSGAWHIAAT